MLDFLSGYLSNSLMENNSEERTACYAGLRQGSCDVFKELKESLCFLSTASIRLMFAGVVLSWDLLKRV